MRKAGDLALGRMRGNKLNPTEAAYENHLARQLVDGEILWYRAMPGTLKLVQVDGVICSYNPDFYVMGLDRVIEIHEVKGFMRDDALVKYKMVVDQFPFRFVIVKKKGKTWDLKEL